MPVTIIYVAGIAVPICVADCEAWFAAETAFVLSTVD